MTKIINAYTSSKSIIYIYGLMKLHKTPMCIQPIVATATEMLEGLSKFLDYLVQPYYKAITSYARDSIKFVKEIRDRILIPCGTMTNFDIVSLYKNIPTNLAINLAI